MIDRSLRKALDRPLAVAARALDRPWITPDRLTLAGLVLGLASAGAAALQVWPVALALFLSSRVLDGLDGALARLRVERSRDRADAASAPTSEAGGFLDIVSDFATYGAGVVGVGIGATVGFGAPWWPFVLVLLAYYLNGTAFLAFSSAAERSGRTIDDGRSFSFLGRIAEGAETIAVHSLWMLFPAVAWPVAVAWAVFVTVSAVQRAVTGYRTLR